MPSAPVVSRTKEGALSTGSPFDVRCCCFLQMDQKCKGTACLAQLNKDVGRLQSKSLPILTQGCMNSVIRQFFLAFEILYQQEGMVLVGVETTK